MFDTANPSIEAAESISVEVESSALIARIKGMGTFCYKLPNVVFM